MNNKYVAPEITVIEMESLNIMAGSGSSNNPNNPNDPNIPDTGTQGWTSDGDKSHGFDIVEEWDDEYNDDDF